MTSLLEEIWKRCSLVITLALNDIKVRYWNSILGFFVFISHGLERVKTLCDKLLWIHNGKIHDYGKSQDVVENTNSF